MIEKAVNIPSSTNAERKVKDNRLKFTGLDRGSHRKRSTELDKESDRKTSRKSHSEKIFV